MNHDEDRNRFVVSGRADGETLEPLPGTDRRLALGLIITSALGIGGGALVENTGSWWWLPVAFLLMAVTMFVVTILDARERGWTLARELRAVWRAGGGGFPARLRRR